MVGRRAFLIGAASLLAAPAIVRADSLMKIVVPKQKSVQAFMEEWYAEVAQNYAQAMSDAFYNGQAFVRVAQWHNSLLPTLELDWHVLA